MRPTPQVQATIPNSSLQQSQWISYKPKLSFFICGRHAHTLCSAVGDQGCNTVTAFLSAVMPSSTSPGLWWHPLIYQCCQSRMSQQNSEDTPTHSARQSVIRAVTPSQLSLVLWCRPLLRQGFDGTLWFTSAVRVVCLNKTVIRPMHWKVCGDAFCSRAIALPFLSRQNWMPPSC